MSKSFMVCQLFVSSTRRCFRTCAARLDEPQRYAEAHASEHDERHEVRLLEHRVSPSSVAMNLIHGFRHQTRCRSKRQQARDGRRFRYRHVSMAIAKDVACIVTPSIYLLQPLATTCNHLQPACKRRSAGVGVGSVVPRGARASLGTRQASQNAAWPLERSSLPSHTHSKGLPPCTT